MKRNILAKKMENNTAQRSNFQIFRNILKKKLELATKKPEDDAPQ